MTTSSKPPKIDVVVPIVCDTNTAPGKVTMLPVSPSPVVDRDGVVWVGMSPKHYEHLAINMRSMLTHIKQQKRITHYLKGCIDDAHSLLSKPPDDDDDKRVPDTTAVD